MRHASPYGLRDQLSSIKTYYSSYLCSISNIKSFFLRIIKKNFSFTFHLNKIYNYETFMINKTQTSMNKFANATPHSPEGAAQRSIKWAGNTFRGLRGSAMGKETT